ncbi:hypothetical protein lerEdw1_011614 [Lerista edwardsae]|nr:hypothetical protein lerEdw1_011614 [Lerista edwardsae]
MLLVLFVVTLSTLAVPCRAEEVIQDRLVTAGEGQKLNLSCQHPALTTHTVFWYRQLPNQALHLVVSGYNTNAKSDNMDAVMFISTDRKSNVFSISRVALKDSAVYFCALSDTVLHSGAPAVQEAFLPCPG